MVILIDIDGTLCAEGRPAERSLAEALPGAAEAVNRYFDAGHVVVLWTARGWDEYKMTERWLSDHGFRYTQLLMGKPIGNLVIDDRAKRFVGWDRDYLRDED